MIVRRLAFLLDYQVTSERDSVVTLSTVKLSENSTEQSQKGNIAFIGGGNYASRVLIPAFKYAGANLIALVTSRGMSAVHHGKKMDSL